MDEKFLSKVVTSGEAAMQAVNQHKFGKKFYHLGPVRDNSIFKKVEKLKGGYGIMADDILAGIFAFITQSAILTYFNQSLIIKSYMS